MTMPAPPSPPLPVSEQPGTPQGRPPRRRRRIVSSFVALLVIALAVVIVSRIGGRQSNVPEPQGWDPRVQDLVSFVEQERGLTFEHPVPVDFLTPQEFRDELTTDATDLTPKERRDLRATEGVLRALGLLHGDVDLLELSNTLGTQDVAAFYDPDRKRVFV